MVNNVACIIARTVSTRLPLKVLRMVNNEMSMLDFMITRLKTVQGINSIYLCTSKEPVDDILEDVAAKNRINLYRGSPDAVIERIIDVGDLESADNVIRITGDNVFTATELLEQQIAIHVENSLEYTRYSGLPIGATAEVMSLNAVKDCYKNIDPAISEYLMLYMFDPSRYKCGVLKRADRPDYSNFTLTVDTPDDLKRTREIFKGLEAMGLESTLDNIIKVIENTDISFSTLDGSATIKMPYGETITFSNFLNNMRDRMNRSQVFEIGSSK